MLSLTGHGQTATDPAAPTGLTSQWFCASSNPTVTSLLATGTAIKWYDAATAGNIVSATTALINGSIYYASQTVNGHESTTRLAVTATINNPAAPTGTARQLFCASSSPTVASLSATGTAIKWYDGATGGNMVSASTALTNGTIYYASQTVNGCESTIRLAVTAAIFNLGTPTGDSFQSFCAIYTNMLSNISVSRYYTVVWYDALTDGNILANNTVITSGSTYYASYKSGSCESLTRLPVTVEVIESPNSPTGAATQEFCKSDNPTVANLITNETGVIWSKKKGSGYGNVLASTTALENGSSYVGFLYNNSTSGVCQSPGFVVTVTINDTQGPTGNTSQTFCASTNATVASLSVTGTAIKWYDAAIGGNVVTSSTALTNGTIYYASQTVNGCESTTRLEVTATINNPAAPTGTASQEFCKSANATVASLQTNESGVTWYDAAIGGNVVSSTTALVNGTIYYGSLRLGTCESPTRLAVTVTISDPQTPTGTASQEFYKSRNATVASLVTNETGVTWSDAAKAGNVVPSTTILTDGTTYYGSLKIGTCESPTRLAVTVKLKEDPKTPTTDNTTQDFLKTKNPTVADLKVNESNVVWYDAPTGGNVVDPKTALVDGKTYYGATKDGDVESSTRVEIKVSLKEDPKAPTTDDTAQDFLKTKNPTVADLKVNESNVVWYDAPTGGNVVDPKTALVDGKTYYGATKDGDVESLTRVAVTVDLKEDPKAPTTTHPTQEFLNSKNPTVADLKVNESNVVWYDAPTGGNVVDPKTALVDGKTYYGATKDGDVESPTRVAVTVDLKEDPKAPTTTHPTQEFLNSKNPTVADLKVNESNVVWYDAPTGGNVVDPKTALVDGKTYYGATKDGDVESSTRLAVTVSIKTLGVKDFEFSNYFVLYPNPVSDVLTIKTKQDAEIQSLEVYDIFGQLVVSVPNAKSVSTVDVSNLSTGNYFIKVKSDKGSFKVKFVKK
ncbi:hypothetical protein B0A80_00215 [Flavobacterium tructae]|nr:hypothetical protein B0A80_00215 [Flavobacterium tructae]